MGTVVSIISSEALQLNFVVCDSHDYLTRRMHIKLLFVFAAFALSATADAAATGLTCAEPNCEDYSLCLQDTLPPFQQRGCKVEGETILPKDWQSACCKDCKTMLDVNGNIAVDQVKYAALLFLFSEKFPELTYCDKQGEEEKPKPPKEDKPKPPKKAKEITA